MTAAGNLFANPVDIDLHEDADPVRVKMTGAPQPFPIGYLASVMVLHLRNETAGYSEPAPFHRAFKRCTE